MSFTIWSKWFVDCKSGTYLVVCFTNKKKTHFDLRNNNLHIDVSWFHFIILIRLLWFDFEIKLYKYFKGSNCGRYMHFYSFWGAKIRQLYVIRVLYVYQISQKFNPIHLFKAYTFIKNSTKKVFHNLQHKNYYYKHTRSGSRMVPKYTASNIWAYIEPKNIVLFLLISLTY